MPTVSAPIRAARDTHAADVVFLVVLVVCAAGIGLLAASSPILALAGASALAGLVLLSFGRRMVPVFHGALLIILIGYAFLGKGFAYLGIPPIYVGEVVLALGILAIIVSLPDARWHPIHLALAIFMGLGAIRTVPYLPTYGIDALRDGVTYGYALFAFAVSLTVTGDHLSRILALYRRVIPAYLLWVPIAAVLVLLYGSSLPLVQAPDVTIVEFKGGDAGVQLAGIGAFLLLGLGGSSSGAIRDGVLWAGWLFALGDLRCGQPRRSPRCFDHEPCRPVRPVLGPVGLPRRRGAPACVLRDLRRPASGRRAGASRIGEPTRRQRPERLRRPGG